MKKKKFILYFSLLIWMSFGHSVFGQSMPGSLTDNLRISVDDENISTTKQTSNKGAGLEVSSAEASPNIMLARSSADYMVTPGDVYTLAYSAGSTPISYTITVDTSYRIRVSNLGIISGAEKTFPQLRREVENLVANNYPLSGVQLVLTQPAVFMVYVNGEVYSATEQSTWALSRLSWLASRNLTSFSSVRDISIKSSNGQTRVYDLFKAQRFGDISQDPYLRPGDVVTFKRIDRVAGIYGAVERPGNYQILEGENLKELVELYANGFTQTADPTRMEMTRLVNSEDISGDKIFLTENDLSTNYVLENHDAISVPQITNLMPVMFVEGAVATGGGSGLNVSNRLIIQFNMGDTYASLVRRNRWFTAVSDTRNTYIIRGEEHIPINLNPMLYDASYHDEILIQENDTLIVPFRQYFVTVAGAVTNPGRYPYIPDRDWEYYIALAGGFMPGRNSNDSITITDLRGTRMKKTDAIGPETVITARTNHGLYYFNQYAPVVTTGISIVSAFLTILLLVTR